MPSAFNESSSWPVWPVHGGKPLPSDHTEFAFEDLAAPVHDCVVSEVFHPRVFAYVPKDPNGRAALVLAGGGYTKLVVGKEGVEVAEWLASLGYHAFVLVHRFPCERFGSQAPVDDAIEAMRQIRARAAEFGLDANRIGVCGLSSGGHLAACLIARYPAEWRAPESAHAHVSRRPRSRRCTKRCNPMFSCSIHRHPRSSCMPRKKPSCRWRTPTGCTRHC